MERYIQAVLPLEYTGILDDIPLEECIEERELVSGKRAYRAPVGKAFRIEGEFTIWYDSSSVELQYAPPQDSKEAFMSGTDYGILADDLDQYLDAVNGDRKQAVRLFEEAGGALPEYFIGKWLIMGVNETGEAVIIVREQIQARIVEETGYGALFPDDETVIFEAKDLQVEWQQRYVEIAQGTDNARLSFVDENESLEFVIPPMPKLSRELIVPWRDGGLRSDSYFSGWGELRGEEYTDDERATIIRSRRMAGVAFADDYLKDFIFPEAPNEAAPILLHGCTDEVTDTKSNCHRNSTAKKYSQGGF